MKRLRNHEGIEQEHNQGKQHSVQGLGRGSTQKLGETTDQPSTEISRAFPTNQTISGVKKNTHTIRYGKEQERYKIREKTE